jgi:hypothetical protein
MARSAQVFMEAESRITATGTAPSTERVPEAASTAARPHMAAAATRAATAAVIQAAGTEAVIQAAATIVPDRAANRQRSAQCNGRKATPQ